MEFHHGRVNFYECEGAVLIPIVVGQSEMEAEAVNIRNRDDEDQKREETVGLQDAVDKLVRLQKSRASVAKLE